MDFINKKLLISTDIDKYTEKAFNLEGDDLYIKQYKDALNSKRTICCSLKRVGSYGGHRGCKKFFRFRVFNISSSLFWLKMIALILARSGSKGIPNKNILKLGNIRISHYSIKAALESSKIDMTVYSSDSNQYIE